MFMLVITVFYSNELGFPLALKNILFQLSCFEQSSVQYKMFFLKRENLKHLTMRLFLMVAEPL